jgi:D-alanyl-lipoteichoic acid acyltransferase DltB (MBOAT superfamily)
MSWNPYFILLIVGSTMVDFFCGNRMSRLSTKAERRPFLYLSLVFNIGLLFVFKYFNFFNENFEQLFNILNIKYMIPALDILLPVGISFYTFQTLSYTIDVYYGRIKHEKHLGIFALFVSFFPQLVAGPIERAKNLLPQLHKNIEFDFKTVQYGVLLILWGLFKKVVIADKVGILVEIIFAAPEGLSGMVLFVGAALFCLQIYCDFSGYSDIAIGSAAVLGIKIMDNFRRPYFSKSMAEMWRRWHISISSWTNDYIFRPIMLKVGSKGKLGVIYSLMVTFSILGIWHGANWTYLAFGIFHGTIVSVEYGFQKQFRKLHKWINNKRIVSIGGWTITIFLWIIGNIFFRSESINQAFTIIGNLGSNWTFSFSEIQNQLGLTNELHWRLFYNRYTILFSLLAAVIMFVIHYYQEKGSVRKQLESVNPIMRYSLYTFLLFSIVVYSSGSDYQFIYFQF